MNACAFTKTISIVFRFSWPLGIFVGSNRWIELNSLVLWFLVHITDSAPRGYVVVHDVGEFH